MLARVRISELHNAFRDTVPNSAYAADPANASTNELTSPPLAISSTDAQLAFRHRFSTQLNFDGCVLQISVDGAPFRDIVAAGGRFLDGGYTGTIGAGVPAWTGTSASFTNVLVALPAEAAGKIIRLCWRLTSDSSQSGLGWFIDSLSIADGAACCAPAPPGLEWIRLDGGVVTLQWTTIPGRTYRLLYKPAMDAPQWVDVPGDVIASGSAAQKSDVPGDAGRRFYRVIRLP